MWNFLFENMIAGNILRTMTDTNIVSIKHQYEIICGLSNVTTMNDLEWSSMSVA